MTIPDEWLEMFRPSNDPQPSYDYVECEICTLGAVVEQGTDRAEKWVAAHDCPAPCPKEIAQTAYDMLTGPNAPPISPKRKAELVMAWRAGYIRERRRPPSSALSSSQ